MIVLPLFILLATLLILLGKRIPHRPSQAPSKFQRLEPDSQVKDLLAQGWPTSSSSCHP